MENSKQKKRNSLKRQTVITVISLVLIAVLAVVYFTVLRPMLDKRTFAEYEMLDGEALDINGCEVVSQTGDGNITFASDGKSIICEGGRATVKLDTTNGTSSSGRFYMFPAIEVNDIAEVAITNEYGTFGFYYDSSDGEYYITGYKGTPYNQTAFSTTLAAARNPLSMERIAVDPEDLSVYGLDGNGKASYVISDKKGTTHEVLVGDMLVTGGGYYCMIKGGDAVYALDTSNGAFFATPETFVTPLLAFPVSENDYYMAEKFTLKKDGEVFISCAFMSEAERKETASTSTYKMLEPANYVPSNTNYNAVLQKFISLTGSEVLKFGLYGETMNSLELVEYNLVNPKYEIYYCYKGVDNYVYVSEKNEDGSYYAYSLLFNLIARVDAETFEFLEKDFLWYVDKPIFQRNIVDVASIRIEGNGIDETFNITGDEASAISVTPKSAGMPFGESGVKSFKNIYLKLLSLTIEDYTESTSKDEWIMRLTVVTDLGHETVYEFYNYSTRRCYFTIDGEGEFYCLRDKVEKILEDTVAIMNGEEISSVDKG
ncbi:MAG: DUF4340 domain-containing protein [Clostridia bacterium]|nr:DUF4340 domain-containing protein [Clostridia bacterium]